MKKVLCFLALLFVIIAIPGVAYAEVERKLPPIPEEITTNGGKQQYYLHQLVYKKEKFGKKYCCEEYIKGIKSVAYSATEHPWRFTGPSLTYMQFWLSLKPIKYPLVAGGTLTVRNPNYLTVRFTLIEAHPGESVRVPWTFHWEILDDQDRPIDEPVNFAKEKAKEQIEELDHLRAEDKKVLLDELEKLTDYSPVYALLERAKQQNESAPEKYVLMDLLREKENALTDDEIASFKRRIDAADLPNESSEIKQEMEAAAAKTVTSLRCAIPAPRTSESLPGEAVLAPAEPASMKLSWTFNGAPYSGTAQENTVYTAHYAFTLADGKRLIPGKSKITINDSAEAQELLEENGKYTIAYTFPATEPLVQTYEITWDGNGGTGTMTPTPVTNGKLRLPKCSFTPPTGQRFDAWLVNGAQHSSGEEIEITDNVTIFAQWKAIPPSSESRSPRASDRHVPEESTVRLHAHDGSGAYVDGSARALGNARELVVVKKNRTKWELSLRDASGREVYSDALMLVTVPVESIGRENLRLLVDGVYTYFSVSEDGKSITFPAYFTKDGKRPVEDLLFEAHGIEVHGKHTTLPGEDYRFVVEEKSARKFGVKLLNAQGKEMHTTDPVWISFPAPEGDFSRLTVKCDGRETTFEIVNGRVRVATII